MASKLTAAASAGRVLTTAAVREHAGDGFAWSKPGRRSLPGVKGRLEVFEVRMPRASSREPWPGYDHHTVEEIRERLSDTNGSSAAGVRAYERRHKRRKGVLKATEARDRRPAS